MIEEWIKCDTHTHTYYSVMKKWWSIAIFNNIYGYYAKWNIRWSEVLVEMLVAQSCPTLWDPMDCNLPGFSVHQNLQARILKWFAIPFSRGSFWSKNWTWVSCNSGRSFTNWSTIKINTVWFHFHVKYKHKTSKSRQTW